MSEAHEQPRHRRDGQDWRRRDATRDVPHMGSLNVGPPLEGPHGRRPPRGSQNPGGNPEGVEAEIPEMGPLNPGPSLEGVPAERPQRGSQNPGRKREVGSG